jgi:hypothetical protein
MKKTYIEIFGEVYSDFHKDLKNQQEKISDFFDKIIVWLIGLSTGAIALIFSSLDKLKFIDKVTLNWTLGFLAGSILFGIVGRVFNAIATYLGYKFSAIFDLEVKLLEIPHKPRKLHGNESAEVIYQLMQEDFKADFPFILEQKKRLPEEQWHQVDENMRNLYDDYSEWSLSEIHFAIKEFNKIMISSFGLNENYFDKRRNKSNRVTGIIFRSLNLWSYIYYTLSCIAFGSAVFKITVDYIRTN